MIIPRDALSRLYLAGLAGVLIVMAGIVALHYAGAI